MSTWWWCLWGLLVLLFVLGDAKARDSVPMTPEKAAALDFDAWPKWTEVDAPDSRIRMLWILHDYVPFVNAGSEICSHTVNRELMKKPYKYDIWVASPGYPRRTYEGVRCFDLHDTETLFKVIQTTHIFHSHSYVYRKQMLYLSAKTGRPFVEWVHTDNYVRSIQGPWQDARLSGRQWTVFNSESLRASRKDVDDKSTLIVWPLVDFREYSVAEERKEPKYVTLSNVNDNKGGRLLIALAKALPELEFLGIQGGYRKQITAKGIPNLKYVEHTTRIKDFYAKTWVQIMPSKEETWGRTAVEAMSSGIPMVVAPTPGLKECCVDAAIYCDRDNLGAWISALRALKEDGEHYKKRSAVALDRARALDPGPDVERLEAWIEGTVAPSGLGQDKGQGRAWIPTLFEKNMLFR